MNPMVIPLDRFTDSGRRCGQAYERDGKPEPQADIRFCPLTVRVLVARAAAISEGIQRIRRKMPQ
jgi:hypothetical protein